MKKISLLIPCYNEELSLPLLMPELKKLMENERNYEWEVLFVNDGSKDNTSKILVDLRKEDRRINYVNLSRNFGKENAMLAGLDYVTGDSVVILDADLQDPPSLIPKMIQYWEDGYEDVYAKRINRGKESWLRKQFSLLFYAILQRSSRFDVLKNVGDFRLLDRCCIESLKELRENDRYTKGMFAWIGYNKKELLFDRGDRVAGSSNWNFLSLFNLAVDGITSFTTFPLRLSAITGLVLSLCAFIYLIYFLTKTLIFGDPVQGFPTLIIVVLFLGGVEMLSLGIVGEYIGHIYNETKRRPVYIAHDYNGEKCTKKG